MNGRSELCICGHVLETHFEDVERPGEHPEGKEPKSYRGCCLGLHCNDCKKYRPNSDSLKVGQMTDNGFKPLSEDWESDETNEEEEEPEPLPSVIVVPIDHTMECDEVDPLERVRILESRARIPVEMRSLPLYGQIVYELRWKIGRDEVKDE